MRTNELFRLLDIRDEDRAGCMALVNGSADQSAVSEATTALIGRLGSYSPEPIRAATTDPLAWLTAFLRLTPTIVNWHQALQIPADITKATLADVGRNLAIHRRSHAEFGLETWDWLIPHYTGMMFALGRLNYTLHRTEESLEGVMLPGDWVPGIHIPESGPLTPAAVDASLVQARAFFAKRFPEKPISVAVCSSWLLDPFLQAHLAPDTNIGSFVSRFKPLGQPHDDATAALFFVFRTRDLHMLPTLPRKSSLQRLVVDRAAGNDPWQIHSGYLQL